MTVSPPRRTFAPSSASASSQGKTPEEADEFLESLSDDGSLKGHEGRTAMAYEFKCADAGAIGCRWKARDNSEEEVLAKVEEHAKKAHNVQMPTETLRSYLRSTMRSS